MSFLIFFIICVFVVIIIFSFPRFSPIPYFPSHGGDIPLILKALHMQNNQTIIDLGAGDGIVIFKAALEAFQKKLTTQFVAVEINPILLAILYFRRLLHPNRNNIMIMNKDMFTIGYTSLVTSHNSLVTFYLYISPWFIEKTVNNITKQLPSFELISYFYQVKYMPGFKEELKEGMHKIYRYSKYK